MTTNLNVVGSLGNCSFMSGIAWQRKAALYPGLAELQDFINDRTALEQNKDS